MDSKIILKSTFVRHVADAGRPPALFAICAGLAMMLSPRVGELGINTPVN
eukprot:COSAG02_NODE_653_length_18827_cov_44.237826_13_plen_50_part_00